MSTSASIDYAVITMPRINVVEASLPVFEALVSAGDKCYRSGYAGKQMAKVFWGYNDIAARWMLIMTGARAADVLSVVPRSLDSYISVARLDVQVTFECDNADDYILSLCPSSRYSSRRIQPVNDAGVTLYVGSPASNLMARVYNKTVESGARGQQDRELVRVEFLLRDRYADSLWMRARDNRLESAWLSLVKRMFDAQSAESIMSLARTQSVPAEVIDSTSRHDDLVSRRLMWLESVVVPALNKMIARYPDAAKRVWLAIDKIAKLE